MADYETYRTEQDAEQARARLRGWPDAAVATIYLPDHADADAKGNVYVLRCAGDEDSGRYLRRDGYAR